MARPPRITAANVTFHVVHRGNDRGRTFFDDDDFRTYLLLLRRISDRYSTQVHAYVLMTNHVHLLMTARVSGGISRTMQHTASAYGRYINDRYQRTGTLWEGRFRSSPVDNDYYCLACYRYIELNPVRAGMVALPEDYRWSSFRENVGRRALSIVVPHDSFLALADGPESRRAAYAEIVSSGIADETIEAIRQNTAKGIPIGAPSFHQSIADLAGVDLGQRHRGRPRKQEEKGV
jgi:putative transposase